MKLDFFKATHRLNMKNKRLVYEIYPEFLAKPSKDLMIRAGKFYAVIDKSTGFWQMNEYKIQEYVDEELEKYRWGEFIKRAGEDVPKECIKIRDMMNFTNRSWLEYKAYVSSLPDQYHQLDNKICFSNTKVEQKDYISKCLPYPLEEGSYESWDRLVGTLYAPKERQKIEWAIGSVISGDSKDIQKFIVL